MVRAEWTKSQQICLAIMSCVKNTLRLYFKNKKSGITGNCEADELARKRILTPLSVEWERIGAPLYSCVLLLNRWASREHGQRWVTNSSCAATTSFWPKIDCKRSNVLFALSSSCGDCIRPYRRPCCRIENLTGR